MKKDILKVTCGTAVLTVAMIVVFAIIGKFDITVLLGALLGFCGAALNFYLLALTLLKSLEKGKNATAFISSSYLLRILFIAAVVIFAIKSPHFNYIAVVIPLIFPRVIITVLEGIMKSGIKPKPKGEVDSVGRS